VERVYGEEATECELQAGLELNDFPPLCRFSF